MKLQHQLHPLLLSQLSPPSHVLESPSSTTSLPSCVPALLEAMATRSNNMERTLLICYSFEPTKVAQTNDMTKKNNIIFKGMFSLLDEFNSLTHNKTGQKAVNFP